MRRAIWMVVAPLALGACNKGVDLHDATVDQFASAARDVKLQKPGRWEVKSQVVAMDLGSTDPAYQPMIRSQAMQPHTQTICVGKDRPSMLSLDSLDPLKTMACHIPRFVAKGGTLDGEVACTSPVGSTTMTETGHYSDESYDMRLKVMQSARDQPKITLETQVNARRIGTCDG